MLLGIGLHGALAYVTFPYWPAYDNHHSVWFDYFVEMVHGFRMPLFFLLSGFFTAMLWRKRGLASLIKHRVKRILLPFLIFMITVIPIINWVSAWALKSTDERTLPMTDMSVWEAAKNNDTNVLERLAKKGATLDELDATAKLPPLCWAALSGSEESARWLLDHGADVNVRSGDRSTPLIHAAFTGHPDLVHLFLEHGAEINAVSNHQTTSLDAVYADWAMLEWVSNMLDLNLIKESALQGQKEVAELLLLRGAKHKHELEPEIGVDVVPSPLDRITADYKEFISWPGFYVLSILHHLWFLWFLMILLVPFCIFALMADSLKLKPIPKWLFRSPLVLLWAVPLTMVPHWFNGGFGADTTINLIPVPHILIFYAVFFIFGAVYYDCDDRDGQLSRFWWLALPLALLLVYPLTANIIHDPAGGLGRGLSEKMIHPVTVMTGALYTWLMIIGSIGLFRKVYSSENPLLRYISDSAYWLYVGHLPLVIIAQTIVKPLDIPIGLKFALVCTTVTAVLLISYSLFIRYSWLGTLLNGKRVRPGSKKPNKEF